MGESIVIKTTILYFSFWWMYLGLPEHKKMVLEHFVRMSVCVCVGLVGWMCTYIARNTTHGTVFIKMCHIGKKYFYFHIMFVC